MRETGARRVRPVADADTLSRPSLPMTDLSSGYFQRALHLLPRQLSALPYARPPAALRAWPSPGRGHRSMTTNMYVWAVHARVTLGA